MDPSTINPTPEKRAAIGWPVGVVVLTLLVAAVLFKGYLLHPNQYMYAFGGDALVLYYDMIYHVCHGSGTHFTGMNYPYGEYIFMTDAQGVISTVLQYVNRYFFPVCESVPGIIHAINIYLLPLASLMVYYILSFFRVRPWMAALFAVAIIFLSPPMLRFSSHFGLAYPFIIPMAMLWFLRKTTHDLPEWRDLGVALILILFTLNNPYTGFTPSLFLALAGLILFLLRFRDRSRRRSAILVTGVGILSILLPYLILYLGDPVTDRLKQQWGFFFFNASLDGLLFPPRSIVYDLLTGLNVSLPPVEYEAYMNIGLVTSLLVLAALVTSLIQRLRRRKPADVGFSSPEMKAMLLASLVLFVYAANDKLVSLPKDWVEDHLGPLLMFKAVARIGRPLYFVLTIGSIIYLDRCVRAWKTTWLSVVMPGLLLITWGIEINQYVGKTLTNCFHENFFRPIAAQTIRNTLIGANIDTKDFQAMLVMPKMMAWTDNFLSDINWASQFFSMRISAATGLPMVSAMLSRMSIGQTAGAIQMLSHPLIRRELPDRFPNQKDLLVLVAGGNPPLSVGEQYIIRKSTLLYRSNDFELYRLRLADLQDNPELQQARSMQASHPALPPDVIHLGFDEKAAVDRFYGKGAMAVPAGDHAILEKSIPLHQDTAYVFSAWTKIDTDVPGVGEWFIQVADSTGNLQATYRIETRKGYDIQDMWIRSEVTFPTPKGSSIRALLASDKLLLVDEVFLYPKGAGVIVDEPEASHFLYNGYKVSK